MQLSFFDAVPFDNFDAFYQYVSYVTRWYEDSDILTSLKISSPESRLAQTDAQTAADAADTKQADETSYLNACYINVTISGASLFFFGKKAFELSIRGSGGFSITVARDLLPDKPSWCMAFLKQKNTNVCVGVFANDDLTVFLSSMKTACFRSLATDPIGCCNSHVECSDARGCVKPRWICSNRCYYRANLESGRIFYGENPVRPCS